MIEEDEDSNSAKKGPNALEKFLNIESTPMERIQFEKQDLVKHGDYDPKDEELEKQIQDIYEKSMTGYISLEEILLSVEPKYRARLAEVALGYLNTGLSAINSKTKHKEHKDKISAKTQAPTTGNKTTNIVFAGDRNEAIRLAKKAIQEENAIDAEIVEENDSDTK